MLLNNLTNYAQQTRFSKSCTVSHLMKLYNKIKKSDSYFGFTLKL